MKKLLVIAGGFFTAAGVIGLASYIKWGLQLGFNRPESWVRLAVALFLIASGLGGILRTLRKN